MGILLAFAPFIVFVILGRFVGYTTGLFAAAVTSALLVVKDRITGGRLKVLELGTFILFTGLAVYAAINHPTWSIIFVRLLVDAGLLPRGSCLAGAKAAIHSSICQRAGVPRVLDESWLHTDQLHHHWCLGVGVCPAGGYRSCDIVCTVHASETRHLDGDTCHIRSISFHGRVSETSTGRRQQVSASSVCFPLYSASICLVSSFFARDSWPLAPTSPHVGPISQGC